MNTRITAKVGTWTDLMAGSGGGHWGLLPAFMSLPWLINGLQGEAAVKGWLVVLASLMACYDLADRRIPNQLTATAAAAGIIWGLADNGLAGGGQALLAGLVGFGLMAVFFFLGAVGAGDVKALGALCTFLSPFGALSLFILTTLVGGLLALLRLSGLAWDRSGQKGSLFKNGLAGLRLNGSGLTMPYGLSIWGGTVALIALGGVS